MKINYLRPETHLSVALKLLIRRADMTASSPALDARFPERQWFVVRTKAKKEDYAVQQLERRGVAVFFPRILDYGREHVAALFPGYVFVHIALLEQYYRVVWTPGVRNFVAFGLTPAAVQESVIYLIRSSAGEGGVIHQLPPFRPGDRVQINGGPLAGLVAVIQRPCSQRGRVQVLLDFLRQGASVELPVGLVDRV
jgi:transcription antitermination factor NusG